MHDSDATVDDAAVFRPVGTAAAKKMRYSGAQATQVQRPSDGPYVYYASAFAMARAPRSFAGLEDPSRYEYFTPCAAEDAGGCAARNMTAADWGWRLRHNTANLHICLVRSGQHELEAARSYGRSAEEDDTALVQRRCRCRGEAALPGQAGETAHRAVYLFSQRPVSFLGPFRG